MDLKVRFREELRAYVKTAMDVEIGNLAAPRQSKAMTRFYVERILRTLTPGLVPSDQDDLEACIVDGPDDCGVDFISRGDNVVLIVQTKFHGQDKSEKQEDFVHFCEVLSRLRSNKGIPKNHKLQDAIADIDWDKDYFMLHYATLGKAGEALRTRSDKGLNLPPDLRNLEDRYELNFSDEKDLNFKLREAYTAEETIAEPIGVRFVRQVEDVQPWLRFETGKRRSMYVGFITGSQIAELYKPHKFRLFALNIRDWVGESSTNKAISSTAVEHPDNFLYFNNGISAVATSVEEDPDEGILECRNFSIINGAQTVRSIFSAHRRNADSVRDAVVMLRISTFSMGKEASFLADVTKFNNTQNRISIADFRSNDLVQKDLVNKFSQLKRQGQPFWYKNKRSRERQAKNPIEMEEFAKTVHAFRFGPHDMFGGTANLFDIGEDGRYAEIFGDGQEVWARVPEEDFQLLAGTWFLCEEVRALWKSSRKKTSGETDSSTLKLALERRYMVFFGVGELLRLNYVASGKDLNADLRQLHRPAWLDADGGSRKVIKEYFDLAVAALVQSYEAGAQGQSFTHRNWFRSKDTLDSIKKSLQFILRIRPGLPNLT
jgi:hypothetical protein